MSSEKPIEEVNREMITFQKGEQLTEIVRCGKGFGWLVYQEEFLLNGLQLFAQ